MTIEEARFLFKSHEAYDKHDYKDGVCQCGKLFYYESDTIHKFIINNGWEEKAGVEYLIEINDVSRRTKKMFYSLPFPKSQENMKFLISKSSYLYEDAIKDFIENYGIEQALKLNNNNLSDVVLKYLAVNNCKMNKSFLKKLLKKYPVKNVNCLFRLDWNIFKGLNIKIQKKLFFVITIIFVKMIMRQY